VNGKSVFRAFGTPEVRRAIRLALLCFGIGALLAGMYVFWPRQAHLRAFDPGRVAGSETAMWRDYYERNYVSLFRRLYALNRNEYGFSPWDSLRLAWDAAAAAKVFQPTRSRAEAQVALPHLERYFARMARRSIEQFDAGKAARLELDWWQLRRENATPERFGEGIARVAAELFGVTNAQITASGQLRAEMMTFRDARRVHGLQDADWRHIQEGLNRSYVLLKAGLHDTSNQ
jgi:hypothetical protein